MEDIFEFDCGLMKLSDFDRLSKSHIYLFHYFMWQRSSFLWEHSHVDYENKTVVGRMGHHEESGEIEFGPFGSILIEYKGYVCCGNSCNIVCRNMPIFPLELDWSGKMVFDGSI